MPAASNTEKEIHQLILGKDELAFAKLCDIYFEPVYKHIKTYNHGAFQEEETLLMDLVTDAFMAYFKSPHKYNPDKLGLESFLVMDVEGNLKNELEKISRRNKKNIKVVGLYPEIGNSIIKDDEPDPAQQLIFKETAEILNLRLSELFNDEKDIQVAQLMLSGERRTTEYISLLGLEELNTAEQNLEIKRRKDRIDKTLKRRFNG